MPKQPQLHAVTYHYVRDLPRTPFPRIKGMLIDDFHRQIDLLSQHLEMASLESAIAFLRGHYRPSRDLCLLTFDDGFKDHFTYVIPLLASRSIQGIFGIITSCIEEHRVATVHMNHFLMAHLPFCEYQKAVLKRLQEDVGDIDVDKCAASESYPLDTLEVASLKYLLNFLVAPPARDRVLREIFVRYLGEEARFARQLYMNWNEVRQLQSAGMLIAGHSHEHNALATLSAAELSMDLHTCRNILDHRVSPQRRWPFSYPYGKTNSYNSLTISTLKECGFTCGFDTETGPNSPGSELFELHRIDCNGALAALGICGETIPAATFP